MVSSIMRPCVLIFSLALIVLSTFYPSTALSQTIGVVKSVRGEVTIQRMDEERMAMVGDNLLPADVIATGPESASGVILEDGTTISIGARAAFAITDFAFEPGADLFELVVRALFGRLVYGSGRIGEVRPDRVRIETPFLTVGTRGTSFAILLPNSPQ